ncbi:diaminopimelate decarboxylase family protein [Aquifex sp.]
MQTLTELQLTTEEKEILKKLADAGYTPAYVYFERILKQRLNLLNDLLKDKEKFHYFFALLANNNPHLLSRIISKGTAEGGKFKGFICSSYEELSLIMSLINLKGGMYIDYHDPVMDKKILYRIKVQRGFFKDFEISLIISVNSKYQFNLVREVLKEEIKDNIVKIFLRIGLSEEDMKEIKDSIKDKDGFSYTYFNYHGNYARFGVEDLKGVMEEVKKENIKVGFHIYPGTNIKSVEYYENFVKKVKKIYEEYKDYVFAVDFGGGFGVNYEECRPEDEVLKKAVEVIYNEFPKDTEKIIEPGRTIIAPSGVLLTSVKDAKEKNGILFLTVNAGFPNFARPYIYEEFHKVELLGENKEEKDVLIGGFSMASQDFLYGEFMKNPNCKGISPVKPKKLEVPQYQSVEELIDTPVVIHCTGAYGYNMASRFSGRPKPMEILVVEGRAYIIRDSEKDDGLFAGVPDIPREINL